jgi:hypothetical protein
MDAKEHGQRHACGVREKSESTLLLPVGAYNGEETAKTLSTKEVAREKGKKETRR